MTSVSLAFFDKGALAGRQTARPGRLLGRVGEQPVLGGRARGPREGKFPRMVGRPMIFRLAPVCTLGGH